jgi:hypothetical protein
MPQGHPALCYGPTSPPISLGGHDSRSLSRRPPYKLRKLQQSSLCARRSVTSPPPPPPTTRFLACVRNAPRPVGHSVRSPKIGWHLASLLRPTNVCPNGLANQPRGMATGLGNATTWRGLNPGRSWQQRSHAHSLPSTAGAMDSGILVGDRGFPLARSPLLSIVRMSTDYDLNLQPAPRTTPS